jgi:hypothetical protein
MAFLTTVANLRLVMGTGSFFTRLIVAPSAAMLCCENHWEYVLAMPVVCVNGVVAWRSMAKAAHRALPFWDQVKDSLFVCGGCGQFWRAQKARHTAA